MSLYNLIDLAFAIILITLIIYSYKKRYYIKVFDYFKLFIFLTLSAKFASFTAVYLQKFFITKADTYTILLLISFAINLLILHFSWKYIILFADKFINSSATKSFLAKLFTVIEVTTLLTFGLYLIMQIYLSKHYLYSSMKKSYSYPKIEKFYSKFINDDFVMIVLTQSNPMDHKDIFFKSFKNSF